MSRLVRYDPDLLRFYAALPAERRLEQANAALRLYLQLHRPYASPRLRGFRDVTELARFDRDHGRT